MQWRGFFFPKYVRKKASPNSHMCLWNNNGQRVSVANLLCHADCWILHRVFIRKCLLSRFLHMTVNRMSCGHVDRKDVPLLPHDCRPGYLLHWICPPREWCTPLPLACPRYHGYTLSPKEKNAHASPWVWSVQQGFGKDISYGEIQGLSSLIWDWGRMGCAVFSVMFWNTGVGWQECRSSKLGKEFRAC